MQKKQEIIDLLISKVTSISVALIVSNIDIKIVANDIKVITLNSFIKWVKKVLKEKWL